MSRKLHEMENDLQQQVLEMLNKESLLSSGELYDLLESDVSLATLKRMLRQLIAENLVVSEGKGRATKYSLSPAFKLLVPINIEEYYEQEIDERVIEERFSLNLLTETLPSVALFSESELKQLNELQSTFRSNVSELSEHAYQNEMERLAIDLSWKSSQIEGNTYSLLETERLLKEKETAKGKSRDEATMLLNHKEAIDFILANTSYVNPLKPSRIEDIHKMLVQGLGIDQNIRKRRVGITGTNYRPLDNEFQIKEALQAMCDLVNVRESIFEKALLSLVLLSYIQAFNDGNKRTARIISNAILINSHYCPISFRTVDSVEYKKAMLIFYEQHNIAPFKEIFLEQFEFAVKTYF